MTKFILDNSSNNLWERKKYAKIQINTPLLKRLTTYESSKKV